MGEAHVKASTFWKAVTVDREEFLEWFLDVLNAWGVRCCVIGGRGVNAYAEPVVSLDLDLVVAADQLDTIKAALSKQFAVARFGHGINVSAPDSDLRVQIQTDPRYFSFLTIAVQPLLLISTELCTLSF